MIEVLDLFSAAAGGWSLGMHRAGFVTLAACEAVDWRRALYAQNNPGVKVYDDVCTLTASRLLDDFGRLPSVVVGSPPCQDISSANPNGKGVEGARSGLYFEAIRIIREVRPRWFSLENSANLRTKGADAVLAALEAIDYTCWTFVVRASDVGANHERPRSWIIGCDLAQVADADGYGRDAGWSRWRLGGDLPIPAHTRDAHHERGTAGIDAAAAEGGDDVRAGRFRPNAERRGNRPFSTADAPQDGHAAWSGDGESPRGEKHGCEPADISAPGGDPDLGSIGPGHICKHDIRWPHLCQPCDDAAWAAREATDADQAGQADGCLEPGLRQAEIADDGCGDGRRDDGSSIGQMAVRPNNRVSSPGCGPLWSLGDLAGRLRLDDGLPSRVAGTRIAVGGPRGTVAASLIVEAYGDAVVPQIPEAIGRAILRVERAMQHVLGSAAP